jgi:hypothetical protein
MQLKKALLLPAHKAAEIQDWRGIAGTANGECQIKCGAPTAQKR